MQNFFTALPRNFARLSTSLCLMMVLTALAPAVVDSFADAKTPGHTYCFYKTCHRVKTLAETRALIGQDHTLPTSFYDDCKSDRYNPCGLTSSGEVFRPNAADNAASSIYPDGTKLLVWSPQSGQALVLRINNAGPYWGNRTLDVSRAAAEKLGFKKQGVASLKARILDAPTKSEATYKKGRTYAPVAGDIGRYPSPSAAVAAITSMQMIATAALAPFNGRTLPAGLVTDDVLPSATTAVAALAPAPKLPAEAVADASSLASLRWPVVHEAARLVTVTKASAASKAIASLEPAAPTPEKSAQLVYPKRGETWSQRASKASLQGVTLDKLNRPATARQAPVRKAEPVKTLPRAVTKPANVRRTEIVRADPPSAVKRANATANRVETRAKLTTVSTVKPSKIPVKALRERDAPNDMSVFSRYNPDAPRAKLAAKKSGMLKTTALKAKGADRS